MQSKICIGVSSSVLQKEQTVVLVIPKVYDSLLTKSTLRILYWKERKVVSIVAKPGDRYKFYSNLELYFKQFSK